VSAPVFAPVDEPTADLLLLVAGTTTPLGGERYEAFLAACEADAAAHGGLVSVNRVRAAMSVDGRLQLEPRAFSAMWSTATGRGKPMVKTGQWETCAGSSSRNDGRPYPVRRWVG
jgi:hypothetical protein